MVEQASGQDRAAQHPLTFSARGPAYWGAARANLNRKAPMTGRSVKPVFEEITSGLKKHQITACENFKE
ncbi:MAG: hypothetical protein ACOC9U_07345 [bacterium]|jgi:hypothetical protein